MLSNLSENYYLRKCFIEHNEIPTISLIEKTMGNNLANVYYKTMSYHVKVMAGLEPKLKGGGPDQLCYPADILEGKLAMKPIKKEHLQRLSYNGIMDLTQKLVADYENSFKILTAELIKQSDEKWKETVLKEMEAHWLLRAKLESDEITTKIQTAFNEFKILYFTSIETVETVLQHSATKSVLNVKCDISIFMKNKYEHLLAEQTKMLKNRYAQELAAQKRSMKNFFVKNFENQREQTSKILSDIAHEKEDTKRVMKHRMECHNLARKMFVAYTEQTACKRKILEAKERHDLFMKNVKEMETTAHEKLDDIKLKVEETENQTQVWKNKVAHILKHLNLFIAYCLKTIPEQAQFFEDLERIMTEQLNMMLSDPNTESYFEESYSIPCDPNLCDCGRPFENPYVVIGDFDRNKFDAKLCHKPESKYDVPVYVFNKKFIYSACDGYEVFSEKVRDYIKEIKYKVVDADVSTNSFKLDDFNVSMRLAKVLKNEMSYMSGESSKLCFCHLFDEQTEEVREQSSSSSSSVELALKTPVEYECVCPPNPERTLKRKIWTRIPPYMICYKKYLTEKIPEYEECTPIIFNSLIGKIAKKPANKKKIRKISTDTVECGIQCVDSVFENLCACLSRDLERLIFDPISKSFIFDPIATEPQFHVHGTSLEYIDEEAKEFATKRAESMMRFLLGHPSVVDAFHKRKCSCEK